MLVVIAVLGAVVAVPMLERADPLAFCLELPRDSMVMAVAVGDRGDRLYVDHQTLGPTLVRVEESGALWRGPSAGVECCVAMAVDPTGRGVVVALESGAIEIRDPETLGVLRTLPGHEERILGLAVSADGARVASVDASGVCRAWSIAEGQLEWEFRQEAGLSRCTWSPDGSRVVVGSRRGEIAVLDASDGLELVRWDAHGRAHILLALAFTPDGRTLVSMGLDGRIRTWDASAGWSPALVVPMPRGPAGCLAIAPDGRRVATGHADGRLRVWCLGSGELMAEAGFAGRTLSGLCFTPDGRRLAVALGSAVVCIDAPGAV